MPVARYAGPGTPAMRILIIEDDAKVSAAVSAGLAGEGFETRTAATGEEGFFLVNREHYDLVLLDVMLPGCSGFDVLQTLRERGIQTPVLVLTARDAVQDRVTGLDLGADDYLVKPFAFPELVARVRALLRRGRPEDALRLKVSDLELDFLHRSAARGGRSLELTGREYELLEYLVRHHGQLVSREMLAADVWKETNRATPLDNVIDVHIGRLRRKVDQGLSPRLIHTVRGVGFVLREGEP
jgi:two-component system, OmpR family, copper resistance phosphate regulon response regulator CusR